MTDDTQDKIIDAFLVLAKDRAVHHISIADIEKQAALEKEATDHNFTSVFNVVDAYLNKINLQVVTSYTYDPEDTVRERLFDLLMQYFDALDAHKEAALNIERGFCARPLELLKRRSEIHNLFHEMLDVTKATSHRCRTPFKIRGLEGIFLMTYHVWKKDDTEDMAKTMAALDKHLANAEKWAEKRNRFTWCRSAA
ncbi:hypothetical protein RYZ26_08200 [Terasakiella sp. A23]|uniref:hypothetical protein n=1 Tax=Terasakiella sp. FCG-A23 TaxID=3080561 RepID=UPI002953325D|nr:hypothetical protein [Terasakiella sp. A23]MDV7339570.1 hypothetical protein [Terasakiella sp. A23]